MTDEHQHDSSSPEDEQTLPLSRRGVLAAGGALGLGLAAGPGGASARTDGGGPPFAEKDHDHGGDHLGEESPVDSIDVAEVRADDVSTTRHADSVAEVNEYIEEARDERRMWEHSGVKIVLPQGKLNPSPEDLPIDLKSGVVVQGQGQKSTLIDVEGIGKPVFRFDRSGQKIRRHVRLRDLRVIGDNSLAGSIDQPSGSKGVLFKNIHYYAIENCDFIGLEDGIVLPGSWTGTISGVHVDQMARDGIRLTPDGPMAPNNIGIVNSEVKRCERHGINAQEGASLFVSGTDISGASKYGIVTDGMLGVAIHGCHLEFNGNDSPRGDGLDRDGDGEPEPVAIGLSPDASHDPTTAVSVHGNRIGYPPDTGKVGIKLGNVEGVEIASNWNGWPNRGLVELGPNIRNVSIHNNTKLYAGAYSDGLIVGPLDGSTIPPHELNDGVWKTADFANYDELAALARDHVATSRSEGIEVVLTDDLVGDGPPIDGTDFPAGTLFRGLGARATTVEATDSADDAPVVYLSRPGQVARNLAVGSADSGSGVELDAPETSVADLSIPESGDVAVYVSPQAERSSVTNVVCGSAVGGDVDVDVDGEGARVVGCDASVDTADVDEYLDMNVDTQ